MKMYVSKILWRDLTDNHLYRQGEPFPYDGRVIPEKRIAELSGTQNKAKFALIELVQEEIGKDPAEAPEAPKRRKKATKKVEE
jgi:hypothetical protein